MKLYWIWLFFHMIVWLFAFIYADESLSNIPGRLFGFFLFLLLIFILPLFKQQPVVTAIILTLNTCLAAIILLPEPHTVWNPFLLFILSLLIAEAFLKLSYRLAAIVSGTALIGMIFTLFYTTASFMIISFVFIYFILLHVGIFLFKQNHDDKEDLFSRYDALLSEFRQLKRQIASEEEIARQEERHIIGHEIHDSVGHKLTALLMQLEAFRLQADEQHQDRVQSLKDLAQESLHETRRAVKELKNTNHSGLQGVLRLIRRLETESFIRTSFSVKHGAFAIPLSGEQSFVIFRSVQEALTNIMKHSKAREAAISFEAPGGSIFRFEISNPVQNNNRFQEGFGLSEMRKRIEKIGGELDVSKTGEQFIVRGTIKLDLSGN